MILWRGQGEPSVMVPPRPLQATPTPSSGMLKGASRPPPQLAPPEKSGLIKARTISPIGGNYVCCFYGMIGGGSTPGAASPHSGRFRGVTGGLEGPKGGDSESPLGPPRKKASPPGEFRFPLQKGFTFPLPKKKNSL